MATSDVIRFITQKNLIGGCAPNLITGVDTMASHSINRLVEEILQSIDNTKQLIKNKEVEIENLKGKYDTAFTYSDGFWDGFLYGSCLISCIMGGMIYFLR